MLNLDRTLVLVGLMGAGKSTVGKRLAKELEIDFKDSDTEVEQAAGCSVADIFDRFGEKGFRDGERKVIARLLDGTPMVLATGGGAFMDTETRANIKARGISVWLRAGLETLVERTDSCKDRPLLKTDPEAMLQNLMDTRYPVYAEADVVVDTDGLSLSETVSRVQEGVSRFMKQRVFRPTREA